MAEDSKQRKEEEKKVSENRMFTLFPIYQTNKIFQNFLFTVKNQTLTWKGLIMTQEDVGGYSCCYILSRLEVTKGVEHHRVHQSEPQEMFVGYEEVDDPKYNKSTEEV